MGRTFLFSPGRRFQLVFYYYPSDWEWPGRFTTVYCWAVYAGPFEIRRWV